MKRLRIVILSIVVLLVSFSMSSAQESDNMTDGPHVFEIAIREVVDAENFPRLAGELEALLEETDGYVGSLEYSVFFSLAPQIAEGQIFAIVITEWESAAAYEASMTLMDNPTVQDYFATIEAVQTILVEPFVKGEVISLADFPQAGEVLEVAVRDLSSYDDPVDFMRSIRGFTDALGEGEGVIREYEWISVDGQYFVGMTGYTSIEMFQAASQNEALLSNPVTQNVFANYPPMLALYGIQAQ